jgi:hypothetical protein
MVDGQNKSFCGCGLSGTAPFASSRQRHPVAEEHAEMCTEQQLESW